MVGGTFTTESGKFSGGNTGRGGQEEVEIRTVAEAQRFI